MYLTPTEQRILDRLQDGKFHSTTSLIKLLNDEMTSPSTLRVVIHRLRKKLAQRGLDVFARSVNGSMNYTLVRRISNDE